ncbi:hypothetical protein B0H63DRAFT_394716 [Podospora didyma]|uniref:Serine protease n=1 Tax=Podospora didyma TaxID=330526 RepID=A0AAE0U0A8_9PEZI|nr:hypothetical protein B0H63DRAFT_394716 [Podospora didyma]
MRYEGQEKGSHQYAMGTGWLISPDILVTAGHNVYDWSGEDVGYGRAVHIKAYIGYHGKNNAASVITQTRVAKRIVTTGEWLESRENRHRDVAIIQLDSAFTGNLRPFRYKATPNGKDLMMGVVGFPADKSSADKDDGEKGAEMYEEFQGVRTNLAKEKINPLGMLQYRISSFGGQSGAPVLQKTESGELIAVGTHVYGGGQKNQASVIGPSGNDYEALLNALKNDLPSVGTHHGINLVQKVEKNGPAENGPASDQSAQSESFFGILKTVTSVAGTVLPIFGGPFAAIAGAAISGISALTESGFVDTKGSPGATERAILAEASLQAILALPEDSAVGHKVIGEMEKTYKTLAPNLDYITPRITPALIRSAKQIVTTYGDKLTDTPKTQAKRLPLRGLSDAESGIQQTPFVEGMLADSKPLEGGAPESWGILGSIVETGLKYGKPILRDAAQQGLNYLSGLIKESASAPESNFSSDELQTAGLVAKRALLGEAALLAVEKLSKNELSTLNIPSSGPSGEAAEESFFDFIKTSAQNIAVVVRKAAPDVIKAVVPIFVDAVAGDKKNGASSSGAESFLSPFAPVGGPGSLRKKPSTIFDRVQGNSKPTTANGGLQVSAIGPPSTMKGLLEGSESSESAGGRREYMMRRRMALGPDSNQDRPVFADE